MKFIFLIIALFTCLLTSCGSNSSSSSSQFLTGITYDTNSGKLIVLDFGQNIVQSVSALSGTATLTTLAGSSGTSGTTNSTGTSAKFYGLQGVVSDTSGNFFVSDLYNQVIRKITTPTSTATVTTFAGTMSSSGSTDGTTTAAYFYNPRGLCIYSNIIYVADSANHTIRSITSSGLVTTLAGYAGTSGTTDGTSTAARFNYPNGVATDGTYIFVADTLNNSIRKINLTTYAVTTLAGSSSGISGFTDSSTASNARFNGPVGVATDGTYLYVTDYDNHAIRKIEISSGTVTTLAGSTSGVSGYVNATGTNAYFYYPLGITYYSGYLYITDQDGAHIRIVSTSSGATSTLY